MKGRGTRDTRPMFTARVQNFTGSVDRRSWSTAREHGRPKWPVLFTTRKPAVRERELCIPTALVYSYSKCRPIYGLVTRGIDLSCCTVLSVHTSYSLWVAKSLSVCPCVGVRLFSDMIDNDITEPVSVAGYTPPRVNIQYTARSGSIISEVLSPPALNPFSRPVHSQILLPMSSCLTALCG